MSEAVPSNVVAPITLIAEWEGPAVNHPALAGDDKTLEGFLAGAGDLTNAAFWVGVTIGSSVLGDAPHYPINPRIVAFLTAWRRRHGQAKLDELRHRVLDALKRGKARPEITPEEIRRRLDVLFDQVPT